MPCISIETYTGLPFIHSKIWANGIYDHRSNFNSRMKTGNLHIDTVLFNGCTQILTFSKTKLELPSMSTHSPMLRFYYNFCSF